MFSPHQRDVKEIFPKLVCRVAYSRGHHEPADMSNQDNRCASRGNRVRVENWMEVPREPKPPP